MLSCGQCLVHSNVQSNVLYIHYGFNGASLEGANYKQTKKITQVGILSQQGVWGRKGSSVGTKSQLLQFFDGSPWTYGRKL